jgi:hypothetical protein
VLANDGPRAALLSDVEIVDSLAQALAGCVVALQASLSPMEEEDEPPELSKAVQESLALAFQLHCRLQLHCRFAYQTAQDSSGVPVALAKTFEFVSQIVLPAATVAPNQTDKPKQAKKAKKAKRSKRAKQSQQPEAKEETVPAYTLAQDLVVFAMCFAADMAALGVCDADCPAPFATEWAGALRTQGSGLGALSSTSVDSLSAGLCKCGYQFAAWAQRAEAAQPSSSASSGPPVASEAVEALCDLLGEAYAWAGEASRSGGGRSAAAGSLSSFSTMLRALLKLPYAPGTHVPILATLMELVAEGRLASAAASQASESSSEDEAHDENTQPNAESPSPASASKPKAGLTLKRMVRSALQKLQTSATKPANSAMQDFAPAAAEILEAVARNSAAIKKALPVSMQHVAVVTETLEGKSQAAQREAQLVAIHHIGELNQKHQRRTKHLTKTRGGGGGVSGSLMRCVDLVNKGKQ